MREIKAKVECWKLVESSNVGAEDAQRYKRETPGRRDQRCAGRTRRGHVNRLGRSVIKNKNKMGPTVKM